MKNVLMINALTIPSGYPWESGGNASTLSAMNDIYDAVFPIITPMCILGAIVCGITIMVGDEHTVDTTKHWLMNIIVGLALFTALGFVLSGAGTTTGG